jgi:hypothetical protein
LLRPRSVQKLREKQHISPEAAHDPAHCAHQGADVVPDLQQVIDAWPTLPEAVRTGIMAMIEASA